MHNGTCVSQYHLICLSLYRLLIKSRIAYLNEGKKSSREGEQVTAKCAINIKSGYVHEMSSTDAARVEN
jgi:hypothetical protein